MTGPHAFAGLAFAGMATALGLAFHLQTAESQPVAAKPVAQPVSCSSCDARHARLRQLQADAPEELK
jgi:hypothetical protein